MVPQGPAAVLPLSSVSRECARGLVEAHRITETGVFRTLALGVRASRNASLAREAVARAIRRDRKTKGWLRGIIEPRAKEDRAPEQSAAAGRRP